MNIPSKCSTCRWWDRNYAFGMPIIKSHIFEFAECRRESPGIADNKRGLWPTTHKGDFCGEHEPIAKEVADA